MGSLQQKKRESFDLLLQNFTNAEKYNKLASTVSRGGSFGNEEVKRALEAGYTIDDVNGYLKYSGITPKGDFAVGGQNETLKTMWGTKDSGYVKPETTRTPFYQYTGPTPKATTPETPATKPPDPTPAPQAPTTSVNPELAIPPSTPEMNVGDSIRIVGENLGIKARKSSASKANLTSKGTSRLTIPRSSGYQPVNMGV